MSVIEVRRFTISTIFAVIILMPDEVDGFNVEDCVKFMEFEEYESCLRGKGHSLEDILISTNGQMNSTSRMVSYAQEHKITLAPVQIKSSVIKEDKFYLSLNNSLSYHIAFADPHFHMSNINPAAIPYTMVRIEPKKNTWIYLKVCIPILDT